MSDQEIPRSELSHLVTPSELGRREVVIEIEADGEARAGLARRFGLLDLPALHATVRLTWLRGAKVLRVGGRSRARAVQSCVVTLEPVANAVVGVVEAAYTTDADVAGAAVGDMAPDDDVAPGADARPEFLNGEEIDVGEVVAEYLGLNLDPYPRCEGVIFSAEDDDEEGSKRVSPFAVLRDLKQNEK